jgi:hypothetical protein
MEFENYADEFQYTTHVPIKKLIFEVSVFRARLNDEKDTEILAQRRIAWGSKWPSPAEAIDWYDKRFREAQQRAASSLGSVNSGNPSGQDSTNGRRATPKVESNSGRPATPAAASGGGGSGKGGSGGAGFTTGSNHANIEALLAQLESCPGEREDQRLIYHIMNQGRLFTRPPQEDFINEDELDSQLEPPQSPTPLSEMHLKRHRERNLPSPAMFICFAIGDVRPAASSGAPQWFGRELVACTLRVMEDGLYFTARPSLGELHTLYYDQQYLYTFVVNLVEGETAVVAGAAAMSCVGTVQDLRTLKSAASFSRTQSGRDLTSGSTGTTGMTTATTKAMQRLEREKAMLLKQAIQYSEGGKSALKKSLQDFAHPPRDYNEVSLHVFCTIESVTDIQRDYIYLRITTILPPKGKEDPNNKRMGVINDLQVTTQMATACRRKNQYGLPQTVHVFNFPLEVHVVSQIDSSPIFFNVEVFSGGTKGDHERPEGYCTIQVTNGAGLSEETVGLWLPKKTGLERLKSWFVGGGPALAHVHDAAISPFSMDVRRAGMMTESVGELHFKLMRVMHRRPRLDSSANVMSPSSPLVIPGGGTKAFSAQASEILRSESAFAGASGVAGSTGAGLTQQPSVRFSARDSSGRRVGTPRTDSGRESSKNTPRSARGLQRQGSMHIDGTAKSSIFT